MRIKGLWTAALTVWLVPVMSARAERRPGRADPGPAHGAAPGWRSWRRRPSETVDVSLDTTPARPRRALHGRQRRRGRPGQGHDVGAQGHLRPQLRVRRRRRVRPGRRRDDPPAARPRPAGRGWPASAARRTTPTSTSICGSTARRSAGSASSPPSRGASPSSTSSARSTSTSFAASKDSACPSSIWKKDKPQGQGEGQAEARRGQLSRGRRCRLGRSRIHLGCSLSGIVELSALIGSRTGEIMPAGWKPARRFGVRSMQTRPSCCTSARSARSIRLAWDRFAAASDGSFLGSWKVIRAERIRQTVRVFEFFSRATPPAKVGQCASRSRGAASASSIASICCLPTPRAWEQGLREVIARCGARSYTYGSRGTMKRGAWPPRAPRSPRPRHRRRAPSRLHRLRGVARLRGLSPRRQREHAARLQEGGGGRADPHHAARRGWVPRRAGAGRSPPAGDAPERRAVLERGRRAGARAEAVVPRRRRVRLGGRGARPRAGRLLRRPLRQRVLLRERRHVGQVRRVRLVPVS